ncbi:hypothetical protein [Methanoculleus chikugoensis]|uniref:hypothetical protein n=1 Tax=Methanoculleus chikugoensis TaxID=118126 RepID=UPI000B1A8911|nr:hypothetical protein [Methanoculleus chikugoensis]
MPDNLLTGTQFGEQTDEDVSHGDPAGYREPAAPRYDVEEPQPACGQVDGYHDGGGKEREDGGMEIMASSSS